MKYPFWTDPNDSVEIIEPTDEAIDKYGHRCGSDMVWFKPEHVEALKAGKILAWNDGEYSTFVGFKDAVMSSISTAKEEQCKG